MAHTLPVIIGESLSPNPDGGEYLPPQAPPLNSVSRLRNLALRADDASLSIATRGAPRSDWIRFLLRQQRFQCPAATPSFYGLEDKALMGTPFGPNKPFQLRLPPGSIELEPATEAHATAFAHLLAARPHCDKLVSTSEGGPMRRRDFGTAAALAAAPLPAPAAPRRNTLMHVGGDYHSVAGSGITSKENLEYNLRYGVRHLTAQLRNRPDSGWNLDEMKRMRDDCDRSGVVFEAIRMEPDYITLRKGPARDRELERIAGNIRKAAEIGVKVITYHWTVIPIRRNRETAGRGNVRYAGFKLEADWRSLPETKSGRVDSAEYWERIQQFLEHIIPVARQNDVRMACHPYDPPGLPFGYQGADNWDAPTVFDSIKRYEALFESPYNGFQLCLGTVAEGLANPRTGVIPIVHYLASRRKIHQIHMRNIRGGLHEFEEVYPDEGVMDFFQIMRILRDNEFSGSICPDHMPHHAGDPGSLQSFAFGYGYIKALIQAVNTEVSA